MCLYKSSFSKSNLQDLKPVQRHPV